MNKLWFFVTILSIFVNLLFIAAFVSVLNQQKDQEKNNVDSTLYPFLSKRIFAENQNDILINFIPLRQALREYVDKQKGRIGVYFEYLPSGTSIGVNDKMEVRLASLIKIPVIMAVYKQIEAGKLKKDQVLTIGESDINKLFGDLWKRGAGAKVTVEELVKLSLIDSDNTATRTLVSSLPRGAIDDVFDSLDIPKDKAGNLPIISPKNYSSILRALYLSSYLKKQDSNEILEVLTTTQFNDKLPAGVPENVKIAHKIGIFDQQDVEKIFSDCGIVYSLQRPYILCIMTKSSEDKAREYMQHLSKIVYGYVVAVKGGN